MKNSIGKNTAKLTATKFINLAIAMANAMLLSRYRTLEEYGTFSQLNMVIAIVTTIIVMGLPSSLNYFLAKAKTDEEKTNFLSNYYTINTILSIIIGLVLFAIIPYVVKYFNNKLIFSFSFYFILIPWVNIIGGSIGNLLIVYDKLTLLTIYNVSSSITLLGTIIITIILDLSFKQYMYINVFIQILFTIVIYYLAHRLSHGLSIKMDRKLIKSVFKFSLPLGLATIVGTLSIELDKLMIGRFFDTETLAVYTNASKEMPVTIIATSLTAILMPHLVKMLQNKENEKAIALWGETTILSFVFIAFFTSALFVFAPEVITILYSEKYIAGVPVFRIYSLVLLLRCTYFGMIMNSMGKTKFIFFSSMGGLILNLILNYLCYKAFGLIGPALATFISIALVNFLQLYCTAKITNIKLSKIFPWKSIIKILILNIFMAIVFYFIKDRIKMDELLNGIFKALIIGVVWMIVYFLILKKHMKRLWNAINQY